MPLNELAYNTDYGEWLPYDGSNYSDRAKAMFFLNSFNATSTLVTGASVEFLDSLNLGNPDITLSSWPLTSQVVYNSSPSDGIYTVSYLESSGASGKSITIVLNKPRDLSFYQEVGLPESDFNSDTAIYEQYRSQLDSILVEDTSAPSGFSINPSLEAFDWGVIETNDGTVHDESNAISSIDFSQDVTVTESESLPFPSPTRGNITIIINVDTDPPFATAAFPPSFTWSNSGRTIEWGPEVIPNELDGNFIKMAQSAAGGINPQSYISLGTVGRYFVEDKITDDANGVVYLEVRRVDGGDFPTGQTEVVDIVDITKVPRLRVKWRRRETTDPSVRTFTLTSLPSELVSNNGSKPIHTVFECATDPIVCLDDDVLGDSALEMGGSFKVNGVDVQVGFMPLGVPTTLNSTTNGEFRRISPWRKGYRGLNRFRAKEITIQQTRNVTGKPPLDGTFKWKLTPKSLNIPRNNADDTYPLAIPHRPPVIQMQGGGIGTNGRGTIFFAHEREIIETTGTVFDGGIERWDADHITTGDGFVIEQGTPNLISFTANLNDTGTLVNTNEYDFTGRVSCSSTVIPAYSGEILAFGIDSSDNATHGFIESNYLLPSGNTARTAVFIDITETDEVLRWDGSGYDPAAKWADTISAITVRNDRTNTQITCNKENYEVISSEKDNYIVAMFTSTDPTDPSFNISDGDEIRILLRNKKVMENWQGNQSPQGLDPTVDGAGYVPIAYRELFEEYLDDFRVEFTAPSETLPPFNIESDGTVDGNITIVPDGDVPAGTVFRLRIQDEDTTP